MEQIENDGTQPEAVETEASVDTTSNETLETNAPDNGQTNSAPESDGSTQRSLNDKLKELGLSRDEYFKLKSQEGSQESGESREENGQESQRVVSDSDRLARIELKAEGITDIDDIDAVMEAAKGLGIDPVDAAKKPFVKSLLEENAKARETAAATPQSSSRNGQTSAKETPEYWLNKAELPPKENKELRRKVMHLKNQKRQSSQMFNN